jgi:hypothetical protein
LRGLQEFLAKFAKEDAKLAKQTDNEFLLFFLASLAVLGALARENKSR